MMMNEDEMKQLRKEDMMSDVEDDLKHEQIVNEFGKDSDEYKEAYGEGNYLTSAEVEDILLDESEEERMNKKCKDNHDEDLECHDEDLEWKRLANVK